MAKTPKGKTAGSYRTVGQTYDGVRVVAPKTKSKTFTEAEVRRAIRKALNEVGSSPRPKPLGQTDAVRVEPTDDGRYKVKRKNAKRASAIVDTQKEGIERARELEPGQAPIVKRVRRSPGQKKGTWRKT
ncbi:DUF2188 domain-containing protein [Aureimonas sp. ME7]|uniref:DUF2188 domain-containing protein n=1 Tax=Aureimonas sp. ME7 TaxID=2744252 RepID=UPI0015F545C8|nr:DUF2188 domain-containing protein [Aureimonas sp. ME7]